MCWELSVGEACSDSTQSWEERAVVEGDTQRKNKSVVHRVLPVALD